MKRGTKPRPSKPNTPAAGIPECPRDLDAAARRHWRQVTATLHAAGLLSLADSDSLACYCALWSRWRHAEERVKAEGAVVISPNGYQQKNPWLVIASESIKDLKAYQVQFGLTPQARRKLGPIEEVDPAEEKWLNLIEA